MFTNYCRYGGGAKNIVGAIIKHSVILYEAGGYLYLLSYVGRKYPAVRTKALGDRVKSGLKPQCPGPRNVT